VGGHEVARLAVARYVADLDGGRHTLLLGCTHYRSCCPALEAATTARIVDPAPFVAERLADWLDRHPQFDEPGSGRRLFLCTGARKTSGPAAPAFSARPTAIGGARGRGGWALGAAATGWWFPRGR